MNEAAPQATAVHAPAVRAPRRRLLALAGLLGLGLQWPAGAVAANSTCSRLEDPDVGHSLQWAAPGGVARDIAAFIDTGAPTQDLVHAGQPPQAGKLVTEPGQATVTVLGR